MPPLTWTTEPLAEIQAFETRHSQSAASASFMWAVWTIDSLHYLDDIDISYETSPLASGGHRPDVIDVAHARWATSGCVTAIDLCAAGLGRTFCGNQGDHELDLVDLTPSTGKGVLRKQRRATLPATALAWVDGVQADPQFGTVKGARNWLTHSRLRRHFTMQTSGPPQRLKLELSTKLPVRQVIEDARDCGTRLVTSFIRLLAGW